jgi:hypothetical protein
MVTDPMTGAMRPADPIEVQQLQPGFLGLGWKGSGYAVEVALGAQPPTSGQPTAINTSAAT